MVTGDSMSLSDSQRSRSCPWPVFTLPLSYTDTPWCRYCQALEPVYAEAAAQLKNESSPVRLAKVDATEEKELAKEFEVNSFPTLKLFTEGRRQNTTEFTGT